MESQSILQKLDAHLEALFADWNIYTTLICGVLLLYLIYPLFFYKEPDVHPFLLARQASTSYVRQPGESAVYRSLETPQSYPLRSGLNVKEPGAPRWTSGQDGDLQDIWKQALKGFSDSDDGKMGIRGRIISVLGKEEMVHHDFDSMTKDMIAIGQHLKTHGAQRTAIYLPNSAELLLLFSVESANNWRKSGADTSIATVIYGITPILLPYDTNTEEIVNMFKESRADCVVAAAGSLPLESLLQHYSNVRQVIWVAEPSSRHMDWNEVPEGVGGKAEIGVWHEIVGENRDAASTELPQRDSQQPPPHVAIISKVTKADAFKAVEYSQKNLVAAVAAQISSLPRGERLSANDVILSLAPIGDHYTLIIVLAALFSNSSLALTSVSGHTVDYSTAFRGISPTVIVAPIPTMLKLWKERTYAPKSVLEKVDYWNRSRSLAAGRMPKATVAKRTPRLIFVPERADKTSMTTEQIFDLRVYTGAHIAYAFTDSQVAGAISQVNILDYRRSVDGRSHLGPPLSCVEVKLLDSPDHKVTDDNDSAGWLMVEGPAVVDGRTTIQRPMTFTESNTLSYAV